MRIGDAKVRAMPRPDGATLRAWRLSRRWDVPELARQLRRAAGDIQIADPAALKAMIWKWERDAVRITERYMLLYCAVFEAEPPQLTDGPGRPGTVASLPVPVSRHDFLRLSASAVSLLDVMRSYPVPDLGSRVGAVAGGRTRVDAEMADGLTDIVLGYRKIYRSAGAASLLGPVSDTLNLLTELAPGAGAYRNLFVSLIGQSGSLAGVMLMLDQGDFATAKQYLAIAAQAAQQVDDDELLAVALGCRAFHSAYGGDLADGVAFATEGLEVAGRGIHPLSHGWVAAVASEMHAAARDEAACMRALEVAEAQLAMPPPGLPWKGIGAFTAAKLSAYRGGDLMRLGRYREARAYLRDALAQLDPVYAKHRCTAHIDLAWAYTRDGLPDEGARHAVEALDIAATTLHADSVRRIGALHMAVMQSGSRAARDLGSKLMQVKAAAS